MSGNRDSGVQCRSVLPFEAVPTVVRGLRGMVRKQLTEWALQVLAGEAELVVSELATNVIKHVGEGAAATLVLEAAGDRLRIEVHDKSGELPAQISAGCDEECGRGLHLLAGMAVDLGAVLTASGKAVWYELSADPEEHRRRVVRAEAVLARYRSAIGAPALLQGCSAQLLEDSASDLIADLLHWVAAQGGDPDGLLGRARMHFEAEAGIV
ncbi:ATP-binding protein [Streptomyces sp. NPDC006923]|uniref:ATP-binding protein n=1 Tax=Streptomyces sp. NPDC006923 TaxID=3155355 RepID=UPI0033DF7284